MIKKVNNQYVFSYWFINNKPILIKIAFYFSYFIIALIWFVFIFNFVKYIINIKSTNQALNQLGTNFINYSGHEAPEKIITKNIAILNREPGKFDLFAEITNPNTYWAVSDLTYYFLVNNQKTTEKHISLYPGEKKYLTEINMSFSSSNSVELVITPNIQWYGFKDALIETNFDIQNAKYEISTTDKSINFSHVTANFINDSIYGFKKIKITTLLTSRDVPIGISVLYLENVYSNQEKKLDFIWPRLFPNDSKINFNIETDLLDNNNLILKSGNNE